MITHLSLLVVCVMTVLEEQNKHIKIYPNTNYIGV